ncbi:MAG: hypothetical protein L0H25_02775 [Micrococcales bacterium]|nr:hypothetical protein [Micrococcales bacterium]
MKHGVDKDFEKTVGMPVEDVIKLYTRAVENDWQTVQATTQQAFGRVAASRAAAAEAAELLRLARTILSGENDDHLARAGLPVD